MQLNCVWQIAKKEFLTFFSTPMAYAVITLFLLLSVIYGFMIGNFFASDDASLVLFFDAFRWVYLFLIPAVAMPMWAEERRSGTLELLMSLPLRSIECVLGKYLSGLMTLAISLSLTFPLVITIYFLGEVDLGKLLCGYLGAFLLASLYLAICSFASMLTKHMMISFLLGLFFCIILNLLGMKATSGLLEGSSLQSLVMTLGGLGVLDHYNSILRGVIDSRDLFYFISIVFIFLLLSVYVLNCYCGVKVQFKKMALIVGAIVFVGVLVRVIPVQFDLSSRSVYSVSECTKNVLKGHKDEVVLRYYVTSKAFKKWPTMASFSSRIDDLLRQYKGIVKVEKIDVSTLDVSEDAAQIDGIEPHYVEGVGRVWHGLVAISGAERILIPNLTPMIESHLEYDITFALASLVNKNRPKVALLSSLPIAGTANERGSLAPWHSILMLGYHVNLTILPKTIEHIDERFDLLIVVHPTGFTKATREAIDNFVIRSGKNLLLLVDPSCFYAAMAPYKLKVDFKEGQFLSSDLADYEKMLGLKMNPYIVAADMSLAWSALKDLDPATIEFSKAHKCLCEQSIITKNLSRILMRYAGVLEPKNAEGLKYTPLIQATDQSMLESKYLAIRPQEVMAHFKPDSHNKVTAYAIEGRFKSNVSNRPALKASKAIVISDVDFLFDSFCSQLQPNPIDPSVQHPVPINDNEAFFMNCVDYLTEDDRLIPLRGGRDLRSPFIHFAKSQAALKQQVIHDELKLVADYKTADAKVIQLRESGAPLEAIREAELERQQFIDEIKNVEQFNDQLQSTQSRIMLWNLIAVPVCVVIAGIVILLSLFMRRRAK